MNVGLSEKEEGRRHIEGIPANQKSPRKAIIKLHVTHGSTTCGIQVDIRSQTELSSSKLTSIHWFSRIFDCPKI